MAESSNKFIALNKFIKKYIHEPHSKKTRAKPGQEKFSRRQLSREHNINDKEFYHARKFLEA